MKNLLKSAALAAVILAPIQANAVTADIPFNGSVTHTCVITVNSSGALGVSTNFQTLSSSIGSGTAGTATVVATGNGFDISVNAPTAFTTKPTEDTTTNTFAASYNTGSGDQTTATDLTNGRHSVDINMSASKSGSDVFEAGAYAATVVLRCE